MDATAIESLVWILGLIVLVAAVWVRRRTRRAGSAFQAGVVGAMYEWQNRDKQKALEVIVDEKRTRRPSEHPDDGPKAGATKHP